MPHLLRNTLSAALLLFTASAAVAGTCSREDIDHYLNRGFTPEQVVELCGNLPAETPPPAPKPAPRVDAPPPAAPVKGPAPAPASPPPPVVGSSQEEVFRIQHSIDADKVEVTASDLIYTRDRCHKFGQEDALGQQPTACVVTRTTISRSGLQVLEAIKGIFLLQDRVFLVKADRIKREVLNPEKIRKPRDRKLFLEEFAPNPSTIDIPLRRGFEPPEIAPALQKLAL